MAEIKRRKRDLIILTAVAVLLILVAVISTAADRYDIQVGTLCYHKFYTPEDIQNGFVVDKYSVPVEEFEKHLQYLKENDIRVITTNELLAYTEGKIDLPPKCMLLTVDDCSRTFFQYAYPLLQKYDMPIHAAVIGDRSEWASTQDKWKELYCTWDELKEMSESDLVVLGSHTYNLHDRKNDRTGTLIKPDEKKKDYQKLLVEDMTPLNQQLKTISGYEPNFFAYPYYAVSLPSIRTLSKSLGYDILFVGDSESSFLYCGSRIHETNFNPFSKGQKPHTPLMKRFSPQTGEDFEALINKIYG